MRNILLILLLVPIVTIAGDGTIPASEISLSGIDVGRSPAAVEAKLGKPSSTFRQLDYLDLHYNYPDIRVSFSMDVVAGLYTDSPRSCTPKQLCSGDSLDKMRLVYGDPIVADRETGRFYEYYGDGLYCWLQIPANGTRVASIAVACQP